VSTAQITIGTKTWLCQRATADARSEGQLKAACQNWKRPSQFQNKAETEGPIGAVGLWLRRVDQWSAWVGGGFQQGSRCCASTGLAFTADFSNVTVAPGAVKSVNVARVPVPSTAGWWQVSALPDLNCALPATPAVRSYAAFATFQVIR
jgi:hypothetical protein